MIDRHRHASMECPQVLQVKRNPSAINLPIAQGG